jgi:hypothetical protein
MSHEEAICQALAPYIKAQGRREEAAGEVYAAIEDTGTMLDSAIVAVEVPDSRIAVETVLAFGLTIEVDTFGNAVRVHHQLGLEVAEYEPIIR